MQKARLTLRRRSPTVFLGLTSEPIISGSDMTKFVGSDQAARFGMIRNVIYAGYTVRIFYREIDPHNVLGKEFRNHNVLEYLGLIKETRGSPLTSIN